MTVAEPARRSGTASLLQADGIRFAYGRSLVLEDVSLDVAPGEFVALVGPNGSGKSTLLKVLLGSLIPERGIVRLPNPEFERPTTAPESDLGEGDRWS